MGCSGSKDSDAKSPRQDAPPPVSPSMQAIEGMDDLDDSPHKIHNSDDTNERCDPDERRIPARDTSSIQAGAKGKTRLSKSGSLLLVMSYRLLSEKAMQGIDHSCPGFASGIDYRMKRVLKEVAENKPDILCLQGVHDWISLESALNQQGLHGAFQVVRANEHGEGCAVLVRHSCLKIAKILDIKQVGAAVLVMEQEADVEQDTGIIVASAWLHNESVDGGNMLDCVDTALKDENFKRHSLIVTGELGRPESEFVQNAVDVQDCVYGLADIKSAYSSPMYTVCSNKEQGVTDYILYQSDQLEAIGTMAAVDIGAVKAANCIPNEDWPSSHISLLAMLEIKTPVNVLKKSPFKPCDPELIRDEDCVTPD